MASQKSSGRSTASRTASQKTASNRKSGSKKRSKKPIHREIGAFVCLFLCVFSMLGCFGVKGVFIQFFCALAKGLVGGGFYVLPFIFLLAFLILLLHNGRPVRLRLLCTFLLPIFIGALVQLVGSREEVAWEFSMISTLYRGGIAGSTGGLIAGFLGMLLALVFSRIGAVILLILLFLVALLGSLNMTVFSMIQAIRNRPRLPKYEEPEEEPVDTAAAIVNHVANKRIERAEQRMERAERTRMSE